MKRMKQIEKGSFAGRLLRLLKVNGSLQESISLQKDDVNVGILDNSHYDHQKSAKIALLEAERKKAEALAFQRRKFIC